MSITRKIPASTPPRRFLPKFFKTGKACGGNNSPRTPLFLPPGFAGSAGQDEREDYARGQGGGGGVQSEGRFSTLWGPRATSGARPTAGAQPEFSSGVKRSRRRASKAVRTACLAQTGLCVLREAEVWKDWDCEGGGLADAVRAAYSVQVCPHGLTCGGRLLSGLRRTVVSKEGISRFLGDDTKCHESKPKSVLLTLGEKQTDDVEPDRKTTEEASPFPQKAAGRTRQGSPRKLWGFGGDYPPRCLFCLFAFSAFLSSVFPVFW